MNYLKINCRKGGKLDLDLIKRLKPKYIFFVHWRERIPEFLWKKHTCIGFHMTDLPYGRGGSPLQNLIKRGHQYTYLTAFRITGKMDAGDIYLKQILMLDGKASDIYERAYELADQMIDRIIGKNLKPVKQKGQVVNFKRVLSEESNLKTTDYSEVYDKIRMVDCDGYPRAYLKTKDLNIQFMDAVQKSGRVEARCLITKKS